jgi:hypothetical protein
MKKRLAPVVPILVLALAFTALAGAEVTQSGNLRLSVTAKLQPNRLPRLGESPVSVAFDGQITTPDGAMPPQLESFQIAINRNGHLDSEGLPVCNPELIMSASSSRALAACRSSLVGQGQFSANVQLEGQEPYAATGRLLVFNGRRGGKPVLYGHIYSPHPFATSFVIPFAIRELPKGRFGTQLTAEMPASMAGWGTVTGIEMKLFRRYSYGGVQRSFLSAGCPAPKGFPSAVFPLARTSFQFAGGKSLGMTLNRTCKAGK